MYERVKLSDAAETIVIAAPADPADNLIEEFCSETGIPVFRGSTYDLLERHYQTGLKFNADAVVKIPSDCPLIDPGVINKVITYFLNNFKKYDYVSNLHPATYPDGNDIEVMSIQALRKANDNAKKNYEREHTTPYFWENPDKFRIGNVNWETGNDFSMTHRWTIDYHEDYLFIKKVYDELYYKNPFFGINDILNLISLNPELMKINELYAGTNWYSNHLDELKTISAEQTNL